MKSLTPSSEESSWILALCPDTGDEVVGSRWHKQLTPDHRQGGWWHCPACDGWHFQPLIAADDTRHRPEEDKM